MLKLERPFLFEERRRIHYKRNARFRAWRSVGVPVEGGWAEGRSPSFLRCGGCQRQVGFGFTLDSTLAVREKASAGLQPFREAWEREYADAEARGIYALELLAGS
jgi:hypothetical protein